MLGSPFTPERFSPLDLFRAHLAVKFVLLRPALLTPWVAARCSHMEAKIESYETLLSTLYITPRLCCVTAKFCLAALMQGRWRI